MAQSQAIFCTAVGEVEIRSVPQPTLVPGHVLVRTKAVALNPTDWKSIHDPSGSAVGARLGVDFAGVVEEIGPGLSRPFEKGDRVCGSVFGGYVWFFLPTFFADPYRHFYCCCFIYQKLFVQKRM
jgi:NADPH:quinone reductase-like Zn-dependent oxidoreductase